MGKTLPKESLLSKYKLKFEKTKPGKPTVSKEYIKELESKKHKDVTYREIVLKKISKLMVILANVVNKVKHPNKKVKKLTKIELELVKTQQKNVIMGICQLLVVVSITYSSIIVYVGVNSLASKVALAPQIIFALIILVKSFSKLYK